MSLFSYPIVPIGDMIAAVPLPKASTIRPCSLNLATSGIVILRSVTFKSCGNCDLSHAGGSLARLRRESLTTPGRIISPNGGVTISV